MQIGVALLVDMDSSVVQSERCAHRVLAKTMDGAIHSNTH